MSRVNEKRTKCLGVRSKCSGLNEKGLGVRNQKGQITKYPS